MNFVYIQLCANRCHVRANSSLVALGNYHSSQNKPSSSTSVSEIASLVDINRIICHKPLQRPLVGLFLFDRL